VHRGEKQDMDFNQLVRIWVDTNVNTHFIVSLPRISPVAELRGNVKFSSRFLFVCLCQDDTQFIIDIRKATKQLVIKWMSSFEYGRELGVQMLMASFFGTGAAGFMVPWYY